MARRKAKDKPEEKGFETVGPLDPSYGSFTIPSYPYGSKKPAEPQETPEKDHIHGITPWLEPIPQALPTKSEPSNEAEETDASALSIETQAPEPEAENPDTTPTTTPNANDETPGAGDTLPTSTAAVAARGDPSRTQSTYPGASVIGRLAREGRWKELLPVRDTMMLEAKAAGMKLDAARAWCYAELDRLYPPIAPPPDPEPAIPPEKPASEPPADAVPGLYSIPENWPPLPDNATLQAELGWVQSQRLAVVEERGNATIVRLERASSPAPSKAALGWLETSIRSYAKYIEVAAKTLAGAADEAESVRRERMRLDEIRALLDEMHRDAV